MRRNASRKPAYDVTSGAGQKRLMYESAGMFYHAGAIDTAAPGDYGADPIGDGSFRSRLAASWAAFAPLMSHCT